MSKMLQEAIIDAEALKEAALRNAEQAVVEKYESEIREAVTSLLEQPEEDPLDLGGEDPLGGDPLALGGEEPGMESDEALADKLAPAGTDGENLCPCPDMQDPATGGQVELDLDQLVAVAAAEEGAEEEGAEGMGFVGGMALEEEINLDEDVLAKLIEDLTVDVSPQSNGWVGATDGEVDEASEQALAQERDSELAEENEELRKNVKDLEERVVKYSKRMPVNSTSASRLW